MPQGGYTVAGGGYPPPGPAGPRQPFVQVGPDGRPLASFGDRLLAYLIDALIITGISMVIVIPAAVVLMVVMADSASEFKTDPVTGQITDGPGAASFILPIILFTVGITVLSLAASYFYYVEMMYKRGSTVGKRAMKLRIIRLDQPHEPLTRGIAAKRWGISHLLGIVVPFFSYLDGFWQLWDKPYQQCLHDKWSGTVVVKAST